jgi:hypothetical protein
MIHIENQYFPKKNQHAHFEMKYLVKSIVDIKMTN